MWCAPDLGARDSAIVLRGGEVKPIREIGTQLGVQAVPRGTPSAGVAATVLAISSSTCATAATTSACAASVTCDRRQGRSRPGRRLLRRERLQLRAAGHANLGGVDRFAVARAGLSSITPTARPRHPIGFGGDAQDPDDPRRGRDGEDERRREAPRCPTRWRTRFGRGRHRNSRCERAETTRSPPSASAAPSDGREGRCGAEDAVNGRQGGYERNERARGRARTLALLLPARNGNPCTPALMTEVPWCRITRADTIPKEHGASRGFEIHSAGCCAGKLMVHRAQSTHEATVF